MSVKSGFSGAFGTGMRHPDSKPGERPGYTAVPAFVVTGAYALRAFSTCAAVRQSDASPALHARTAGSNRQARGSLTIPSLTPSRASQAAITASAKIDF